MSDKLFNTYLDTFGWDERVSEYSRNRQNALIGGENILRMQKRGIDDHNIGLYFAEEKARSAALRAVRELAKEMRAALEEKGI